MKPTMRGLSVATPSIHYRWTTWLKEGSFKEQVDLRKHRGHPVCRVTGKRKFVCTDHPGDVTCRGCLQRMALQACGEESWRRLIIKSYARKSK